MFVKSFIGTFVTLQLVTFYHRFVRVVEIHTSDTSVDENILRNRAKHSAIKMCFLSRFYAVFFNLNEFLKKI